jgi:hypothetical protein
MDDARKAIINARYNFGGDNFVFCFFFDNFVFYLVGSAWPLEQGRPSVWTLQKVADFEYLSVFNLFIILLFFC